MRHAEYIDTVQLVLIDKHSKRSALDLSGLTDTGKRVIFPLVPVPPAFTAQHLLVPSQAPASAPSTAGFVIPRIGDYVAVHVTSASGLVGSGALKGAPLGLTTMRDFNRLMTAPPPPLPATDSNPTPGAAPAPAVKRLSFHLNRFKG